jgi:hypothetical protein
MDAAGNDMDIEAGKTQPATPSSAPVPEPIEVTRVARLWDFVGERRGVETIAGSGIVQLRRSVARARMWDGIGRAGGAEHARKIAARRQRT